MLAPPPVPLATLALIQRKVCSVLDVDPARVASNARDPVVRLVRMIVAWRLARDGYFPSSIAAATGRGVRMVRRDIQRMRTIQAPKVAA